MATRVDLGAALWDMECDGYGMDLVTPAWVPCAPVEASSPEQPQAAKSNLDQALQVEGNAPDVTWATIFAVGPHRNLMGLINDPAVLN
ncbi:hypothetical protein HaLaN_33118, partial [Haematococcus lacustris]